jgi:hypothetical protein
MESEEKKYIIWGEDHGPGHGEGVMGYYATLEEVQALPKKMYSIKLTRATLGYHGDVVHVFNKPSPVSRNDEIMDMYDSYYKSQE